MKTLTIGVVALASGTAIYGLLAQAQSPSQPQLQPFAQVRFTTVESGLPKSADRNFASLSAAHAAYTGDFASKPGFGSSRIVFLPGQDFVTMDGQTYRFNTPELLGLENNPVVAYQRAGRIENLSVAVMSKKELRSHLARRSITVVESNAIVELRAGKDLVSYPEVMEIRESDGRETGHTKGIRAIGALRAQTDCAHCHGVKEGTLLGAFSYALVPTNAIVSVLVPPNEIKIAPSAMLPTQVHTNLSLTLMRRSTDSVGN